MIKNKGFTLVELLMALLITSIITIIIYTTFNNEIKSYVNQKKINTLKSEMRLALSFIERELRYAGFDSIGMADVGFEKANEDMMVFTGLNTTKSQPYKDNNDIKRYAYYLDKNSNNTLKRYSDNTTNGVLPTLNDDPGGNKFFEDVVSFKLKYYSTKGIDSGEIELKDGKMNPSLFSSIRAVGVDITLQVDLWGRPPYVESVNKIINCRNMGI